MTKHRKKIVVILVLSMAIFGGVLYGKIRPYTDRMTFVGGKPLFIQDRTTSDQWQKGLSGSDGICRYCGMLFLFPEKKTRGFWMKEMQFDIDIIWMDGDVVVHIENDVSHETPEKIYKPPFPVNAVLEIPAGSAYARGIHVGDKINVR